MIKSIHNFPIRFVTPFPSPLVGEGQGGGIKQKSPSIVRARNLRKNLTDVEKKLWYWLRRKNIQGARFRRQAPIGKYIADFACYDPKLIIELDGGQHAEQQSYDQQRDAWFKSQGFDILRFWNSEVIENLEGTLETIWNQIEILRHTHSPSLTLPHKGGGNPAE